MGHCSIPAIFVSDGTFTGGMSLVPYGPVLPPQMPWERTFRDLLHDLVLQSILAGLQQLPLPPLVKIKGNWTDSMHLIPQCNVTVAPLLLELPTSEDDLNTHPTQEHV